MAFRDPGTGSDELVMHASFLRALARGMLADEHLAEDVVQQAFLRALARPPAGGVLRAWLARVVRNLALNTARGEGRRTIHEREVARAEVDAAHERAAFDLALQREVADAVSALDDPYRTVVHLRYFRGRGTTAIARELGVPQKTIESRLTRAHALLRRRLEPIRRCEDGRSHAIWAAAAPGGPVLGGVLMSKQTVLIVLGGASLLGLLLVRSALGPGTDGREASVVAELVPAPRDDGRADEAVAEARAEALSPAPGREVAPEASANVAPPPGEPELESVLERLAVVLDRSLEGRMDPGAILDAALIVAERRASDPLAELDASGRLLMPIEGLPDGVEAELCVSKPNVRQETVLTLQIRMERPEAEPLVFEGHEREGPSVQITTRTDAAGELLHFGLLTGVQPDGRAPGVVLDPPRFTYGLGLHTPLANPSEWKLTASGMREVEGSLQPDGGRSYRSGGWEVPQVLEGDPWPRLEEMRALSGRMLEMHREVKRRTGR